MRIILIMSKSNKKVDYKARLEHKLYLARETPEPIFDLSDCALKSVPQGIYSLCRVFLKQNLLLSDNRLETLSSGGSLSDLRNLCILDLRNNRFSRLPEDIDELSNLKELNIKDNLLKKLPDSITSLSNLKILNISNNKLSYLPDTFGNLVQLEILCLDGNAQLKNLPKSMHKLTNLQKLQLDSENFIYPPKEICSEGASSVIQFISNDCGITYTPACSTSTLKTVEDQILNSSILQEKVLHLERLKDQRRQELIEIEKYNEMLQSKEIELQNAIRQDKQKLLTDLAVEVNKFDNVLARVQKERESDRNKLIKQLHEEEQNSDASINKLLITKNDLHTLLAEQESRESTQFANLKAQQEARRLQLLKEAQDEHLPDRSWLQQYQTLLQKRPDVAKRTAHMDPSLVLSLLQHSVLHCIPLLATIGHSKECLAQVNDSHLIEAGVDDLDEREKLLAAIHEYLQSTQLPESGPSAPPEPSSPTAPPPIDCVICLDSSCQVIFVPCGHMCSCQPCSRSLQECPICRTQIGQKIQVFMP